jgi:hypothetical protein
MALTVTDLRTTRNAADATTGWNTGTLTTSQPDPVEGTGCLGFTVSTATGDIFHTGTSINLSNSLVYVWAFNRAELDTIANGGVGIHLGDGTNRVSFHLAGSNRAGFRHDTGPAQWNCLVLDTTNLPAQTTVRAGSLGALNLAAITQIGLTYKTLAKAIGGLINCFVDAVRVGAQGLRITAGTSGDPGKFFEIAAADRTTSIAGGVCRELGTGLFGLQGALTFGQPTTGTSHFADTNVAVVFENRNFGTDKYGITIVHPSSSGTTNFTLGAKTGSGIDAGGSDGCSITAPAAFFTAAVSTVVGIYGSTLSGFTQGITLRSGHEFIGGTISTSGTIETNGATMVNTAVVASSVGTDASALSWNVATDPDTFLHGMEFVKGTAAHHAIAFGTSSPTDMVLRNISFSGFNANNNQNDSTLHILRTTGTVTISLVGCSGNISYKTAGATVVLVQDPVTTTVTVRDIETGDPVENARVYMIADSGGPLTTGTVIIQGLTNASGQISDTRTLASPQPVTGWVRRATSGRLFRQGPIAGTISNIAGLSLTVQLIPDE